MSLIDSRNTSIKSAAFTRTELVFTIFVMVVVSSLLAACASKASRQNELLRCKDNLKNIALALQLWMDDNEATDLVWRTRMDQGGTLSTNSSPERNECWFHMISLSNHLISPKSLVDPADRRARIAKTWDTNPRSGLAAVSYRDQACSYAIALDHVGATVGAPPPLDFDFNSALFLDKHLDGKSNSEQCKATKIASTGFQKPFDLWWKRELHGPVGNVALLDGSVEAKSDTVMERILRSNIDFSSLNGSTHVLFPNRPKNH